MGNQTKHLAQGCNSTCTVFDNLTSIIKNKNNNYLSFLVNESLSKWDGEKSHVTCRREEATLSGYRRGDAYKKTWSGM